MPVGSYGPVCGPSFRDGRPSLPAHAESWAIGYPTSSLTTVQQQHPLSSFTPRVRAWFAAAFAAPTPAQAQAWPAIARGEHVLLSAPTGSGKTLAAFLWALDRLASHGCRARAAPASSTSRL